MRSTLLALAALAGLAAAQDWFDPFLYPAGTMVPGYTEHRGDWMCTGNEVQSQQGITFQELTSDTFQDRNACVETLAIYDLARPGLSYTGPLLRHTGTGATATYFMIKVQDNATPYTGWDTWWCYFYNGASFSLISNGAIAPNTIRARVRLQVIEQVGNVRVQVSIDTDLDGLWNIANDTVTTQGLGTSGRIGINGYQSALADDLKYFSGTLYLNGMPRIGTSVDLKGNGTPALGYQGACSLGHAGFSIGGLRAVPLDLDGLLILSMVAPGTFVNFAGVTDGGGDFTMSLAIPASPALVGNTIWSSAITFAPGSGVQEIMPDVQITFLP